MKTPIKLVYETIYFGWDIEYAKQLGLVRACQIFLKPNDTFDDMLVVEYNGGYKRMVDGKYLVLEYDDIEPKLKEMKRLEIEETNIDIQILQEKLKNIEVDYRMINIEPEIK